MKSKLFGRVAEWFKAPVLKTGEGKTSVSSNLTSSANSTTMKKEMTMSDLTIDPHDFVFRVGNHVKDKITGFEGIVIQAVQWINNCNTYMVQPKGLDDGKVPDAFQFDEPQLELIEASEEDISHVFKYSLGTKAKERITGYEGVIVARLTNLSGQHNYGIQPTSLKDGKIQEREFFNVRTIELIEEEPVHKSSRKTGGPAKNISNARF